MLFGRTLPALLLPFLSSVADVVAHPPKLPSIRHGSSLNIEAASCAGAPIVQLRNGSLCGIERSVSGQAQVAFLGISFAQPPVGDLRLRHPLPYDGTYQERDAKNQPNSCPGYGGFSATVGPLSEDCLYLNVVRPKQQAHKSASPGRTTQAPNEDTKHTWEKLPVLVWIYGGGFTAGGIADPRFDMSYIVAQAVKIGKPIIAVSLNYRVAGFGFLTSKEVLEADGVLGGVANIGLYDQRLALRWIRENVAAFGGDPDKITIWGESAGAFSVGYHLTMFDGNSDDLFRGAILESGTALGPALPNSDQLTISSGYQDQFDDVVTAVGCDDRVDKLQCLREVPYKALFEALKTQIYTPVLDGKMFTRLPSESFEQNATAQAALLLGSNTDEGTASFWGPRGTLNTTYDVIKWIKTLNGGGLDDTSVNKLLELYPDDPAQGCPFDTDSERFADQGWQYKRGAAIATDLFVAAGGRHSARHFASLSNDVYSYRFDQPPWDGEEQLITTVAPVYSTHFTEVCLKDLHASQNLLMPSAVIVCLWQSDPESLKLDRTISIKPPVIEPDVTHVDFFRS